MKQTDHGVHKEYVYIYIYINAVCLSLCYYTELCLFLLFHQPIFCAYFQHVLWNIRLETLEVKVEMHLIY